MRDLVWDVEVEDLPGDVTGFVEGLEKFGDEIVKAYGKRYEKSDVLMSDDEDRHGLDCVFAVFTA
jgi:hypothetical protein